MPDGWSWFSLSLGLTWLFSAVQIVINSKKVHLGTFADKVSAARAWDLNAVAFRGKHTMTNFDAKDYEGLFWSARAFMSLKHADRPDSIFLRTVSRIDD